MKAAKKSEEMGFGRKAVFFLLKFFVIYGVLQALILAMPLGPLQDGIASLEAGFLNLESEGNRIFFKENVFSIVANCTGLVSVSVLASIVFSLRKPGIGKKLGLFGAGAAVLFPLNIARIYFVVLAATFFGAGIAESLHVLTWFLVSAAILALWYFLTQRIAKVERFEHLL